MRKCEVTPQAKWPNAKLILKRDEINAAHALYGPSGFIVSPLYRVIQEESALLWEMIV